jgi:ABC-type antimicrobial peptide transport system permease subunit
MLVRVAGDPGTLLAALRREITEVDPDVPISEAMTISQLIESMFMPVKMATATLGYAGVLALILSGVGVYGVLAFSVSQRTAEIGIRMAIGARPSDIRRLIVREGLMVVIVGIVVGMFATLVSTRLLTGYLYGVGQADALTFVAAPMLLVAIAVLSIYLPARKAAATHPLEAIRCE